jgi:hypothetical protein
MASTRLLFRAGVVVALGFSLAACGGDEEEAAAISAGNRAPTISGTPATTVSQGSSYSFTPSAADADGDALLFGIDAKPTWATFNTSTGSLSGTPGSADVGMHRGIVVWVSDGKEQTLLPAFDVQVTAPYRRRRILYVHADRFRSRRSDADVFDSQPSVVGRVRRGDRPAARLAAERGNVRRRRDLR